MINQDYLDARTYLDTSITMEELAKKNRKQAMEALTIAKEVEAYKIAKGHRWVQEGKTWRLKKAENPALTDKNGHNE